MNAALRALLPMVLALGLVALFFSLRSGPKEAVTVGDEVASARDQPRAASTATRLEAAVANSAPAPARLRGAGAAQPENADSLAAQMHALEESSPERALELARRAQALWPAGPRAPEFAATEVKCLYRLGRASEGRGAAETMVNRYPTSPWALEVEKQTGAHPYVNH